MNEDLMNKAAQLAVENVISGHGGPFGAIVVKNGQIIGRGQNEVTATNDPTAHAEVQAIREACSHSNSFQLTGCILYTSCEPCPMCLGAIYWARPDAVYYACSKEDAARVGFDDRFIYEEIALPIDKRSITMKQLTTNESMKPFQLWEQSVNKIEN